MLLTASGKKACPGLVALLKTRRMSKLYLFTPLLVLALTNTAQAQGITLDVRNVPLDTVFARIQEQSPYRFVYTSEELSGTRLVSLFVRKAPLWALLGLAFKEQPVDYSVEGRYVYVRRKEESKAPPAPSNQTTEIRGKISNDQGEPMDGATVQITKLGARALSNAKGEFVLRNLKPGTYELEVTFIGYERSLTAVNTATNAVVTIVMKRSVNSLDETVIKGYYTTTNRLNIGSVVTV